ncbi:MAG: phage virion morphogenesis protein [Spirochaetales bacterium]|jgi:phage virion morphogenesis protein|nr:phage virion morphogenesis protein [Spirochaetales bacterium]
MAGAQVAVDVKELNTLAGILNRAKLPARERQALLADIGAEMESQDQARFDTQESPEGEPWKRLAQKTAAYYAEQGLSHTSLLVREGGLRDSIESQVAGSWSVLAGATAEYAAIHQFGGEITPKSAPALYVPGYGYLQKVTIPARPYLGVSEDDAGEIAGIARNFLAGRLQ